MALDKATLISNLTTIFENLDADATAATKAEAFADAIDAFVKTATVNTTVSVTSVSGVTTGAGVSGPGSGTGTTTIETGEASHEPGARTILTCFFGSAFATGSVQIHEGASASMDTDLAAASSVL